MKTKIDKSKYKKISISVAYEVEIQEDTKQEVLEELALALAVSNNQIDNIVDTYEFINDEVYDLITKTSNPKIFIQGYGYLDKTAEEFYKENSEEE